MGQPDPAPVPCPKLLRQPVVESHSYPRRERADDSSDKKRGRRQKFDRDGPSLHRTHPRRLGASRIALAQFVKRIVTIAFQEQREGEWSFSPASRAVSGMLPIASAALLPAVLFRMHDRQCRDSVDRGGERASDA